MHKITDLAFEFFPIINLQGKQIGTLLLCLDFDFTKIKPVINSLQKDSLLQVFKNCHCVSNTMVCGAAAFQTKRKPPKK